MVEINYLTYFNKTIYMHGFDYVVDMATITVHEDKNLLVIGAGLKKEDRRTFTVTVSKDRTIHNERLFQLLMRYALFEKRFAYHSIIKCYFPTDMDV